MKNSKEGNRTRVKRGHEKKQQWLKDYKTSKGCYMCNIKDPVVLEFHHIDEKSPRLKRRNMSRSWHTLSYNDINVELERVIILCANCHRRLHHLERMEEYNGKCS